MTLDEFRTSLQGGSPPEGLDPCLTALWVEARGDWKRAHEIVQEEESPSAAWVHAYLHRKEGDASNAGYWYRRAARPHCANSHDEEWEEIVRALLER